MEKKLHIQKKVIKIIYERGKSMRKKMFVGKISNPGQLANNNER